MSVATLGHGIGRRPDPAAMALVVLLRDRIQTIELAPQFIALPTGKILNWTMAPLPEAQR